MKMKIDIVTCKTMSEAKPVWRSLPWRKRRFTTLSLTALTIGTTLLAHVAVAQSDSGIGERRAQLCANHPTVCGAPAGTPEPTDSSGLRDHLRRMWPSAHSLKKAFKKGGPQIIKNGVVMVMPIPVREALYQAELRAVVRKTTAQSQAGEPIGTRGGPVTPVPGILTGGALSPSGMPMQPGVASSLTLGSVETGVTYRDTLATPMPTGNQNQQFGSGISPEARRLDLETCKATRNCR